MLKNIPSSQTSEWSIVLGWVWELLENYGVMQGQDYTLSIFTPARAKFLPWKE